MIANERQYQITKEEAGKFAEALANSDKASAELDPLLQKAMRDQFETQLAELHEEMAEYERSRDTPNPSVAATRVVGRRGEPSPPAQ